MNARPPREARATTPLEARVPGNTRPVAFCGPPHPVRNMYTTSQPHSEEPARIHFYFCPPRESEMKPHGTHMYKGC